MVSELNLRLLPKMSLKIWILFMFGFAIYLRSSAQLCVRRYVKGQWISKGDCGGPGRMSEMQKELQRRIKDKKKKKCNAGKEGWIVFQRRINGNVHFYRGWNDYKEGFGDCDGNFWLGLEELHEQTKGRDMELEINMVTKTRQISWVAKYSNFSIGSESEKYTLHVSGYSGNGTGDGLAYHNNRKFSAKGADNDGHKRNCASRHGGGWWYNWCAASNLNGYFHKRDNNGFWWEGRPMKWTESPSNFLKFSVMKIRKRM